MSSSRDVLSRSKANQAKWPSRKHVVITCHPGPHQCVIECPVVSVTWKTSAVVCPLTNFAFPFTPCSFCPLSSQRYSNNLVRIVFLYLYVVQLRRGRAEEKDFERFMHAITHKEERAELDAHVGIRCMAYHPSACHQHF